MQGGTTVKKIVLFAMPVIALGICFYFSKTGNYKIISGEELREVLHKGERDSTLRIGAAAACCNPGKDLVILNVVKHNGLTKSHITGSLAVCYHDLKPTVKYWEKDKHIVVYCDDVDPELALQAARLLVKSGFNHVQVYKGGLYEWVGHQYPVCAQAAHLPLLI